MRRSTTCFLFKFSSVVGDFGEVFGEEEAFLKKHQNAAIILDNIIKFDHIKK